MFLVTGGLKEPDEWIRTTEVYDPNTESWRFVEDLPKPLRKGFNKKVDNFPFGSRPPSLK